MAFRARNANYNALKSLSLKQRLDAASDISMGQTLISMLTPTQAAELFPHYWIEKNPNISGFLKAIPTSLSATKQREYEKQIQNTASGEAAGANYNAGGYRRKWQKEIDDERQRTQITKKGQTPPPQLSPEQRQAFNALKAGDIDINDERMKWLKNAPKNVLKDVGIDTVKDDKGNEKFHYTAPVISDEEARKSMIPSGNFEQKSATLIPRLQKDLNITREQASGILGSLGGETDGLKAIQEGKPIAGRGGFGWAQWTGPRRREFEAFAAARGLSITSDEANYQFLVHELLTSENRALQQLKNTATVEEAARTFTGSEATGIGFLRPRVEHYEKSVSYAQKAFGSPQVGDALTQNYTPEQISARKEQLAVQAEAQRLGSLAAMTSSNLPSAGPVGGMNRSSAVDNMMKIVGKSENDPDQKAMIKKFLEEGGHGLDPEQTAWCAATVGAALRQAGYKDIPPEMGGNVATSYGGWGRQVDTSKEGVASGDVVVFMKHRQTGEQLGIGQVGGHVGMATGNTRVNQQGQTEIETIEGNVGNQGTRKWHVIGDRGMQIRRAREGIEYDTGAPLTQPLTADQIESSKVVKDIKGLESVTQPQGPLNAAGPTNIEKSIVDVEKQKKLAAQAAEPPAPSGPTPERYNVNVDKFISAIKSTEDFKNQAGIFGGMVPNSAIISGFNDDPRVKSAGVRLDENGVMHFTKGMTPEAKEAMSTFDTKSFMTKIEDKKKEDAATKVPGRAEGGPVQVNTDKITAYPIDGLRGDNAVVVNAQQKPLFTMNTNESVLMEPGKNKAEVIPNEKSTTVAPTPKESMSSGIMEDFHSTIHEIRKDFANLKAAKVEKPDLNPTRPLIDENGWLEKMNQTAADPFKSPSARRVAYRAGGMETGDPSSGFHYSRGNNS